VSPQRIKVSHMHDAVAKKISPKYSWLLCTATLGKKISVREKLILE